MAETNQGQWNNWILLPESNEAISHALLAIPEPYREGARLHRWTVEKLKIKAAKK